MTIIKVTVFLEGPYWVATFERTDQKGYQIARHIFGGEPTNPEIYDFVLNNYESLRFGPPHKFELEIKRLNPKRALREVKKEMEKIKETSRPSTFAQDCIREELEQNKKTWKKKSREKKEEEVKLKFAQKQEKRKQKQRGH